MKIGHSKKCEKGRRRKETNEWQTKRMNFERTEKGTKEEKKSSRSNKTSKWMASSTTTGDERKTSVWEDVLCECVMICVNVTESVNERKNFMRSKCSSTPLILSEPKTYFSIVGMSFHAVQTNRMRWDRQFFYEFGRRVITWWTWLLADFRTSTNWNIMKQNEEKNG